MKLLVFDTETTGKIGKIEWKLPINKETVEHFPYVVQFSFMLFNTETYKYTTYDYVIKVPTTVDICEEVVAIHGITKGRSRVIGDSFKDIYSIFEECEKQCDMVIAHNSEFDTKMIRVECARNGIPYTITKPVYCTMKSTTQMCKLPKPKNKNPLSKDYKWPALNELHYFLFQEDASGLHNSMVDVIVCLRCYMKVMHTVDICEKVKKLKCV